MGTYDGHVTAVTHKTMDLVMERFKTVVGAGLVGFPALVTKMLEFVVDLQQIHKSLAVRRLGLDHLGCYRIVAARSTLSFAGRVPQRSRPNVERTIREVRAGQWMECVRVQGISDLHSPVW